MALTLGRADGETIEINGPAKVTVFKTRKGYVHLSFDAPESTHILRGELVGTEPKPKQETTKS